MSDKKQCECEFCTRRRAIQSATSEIRQIQIETELQLANVKTDLARMNCIMAGTWPGGKEILLKAIKNYE